MVLLNFSFTGENTTGSATFTLTQEYKFKNAWLKDVKYTIANDKLEEKIGAMTSNVGLIADSTITSPLAVHMDFLDSKDCVLYSLADGAGETLNDAKNITGLIPFGNAGKVLADAARVSDPSTMSHSYPYHIIRDRPQTWASGKTLTFDLYYRDVQTDGIVKDWAVMSGTTDAFSDLCSIDITIQLE